MNPQQVTEYMKAIADGLEAMAGKLQVPAEKLMAWAVRGQIAGAISEVLAWLLVVVVCWRFATFVRTGLEHEGKKAGLRGVLFDEEPFLLIFPAIVLLVAFVMVTIGLFADAIPSLVAPEWHAFKALLETARGK